MMFDIDAFDEFFWENSILQRRYNLGPGLVNQIQLYCERYNRRKNIGEDVELVISCVLLVLSINRYKLNIPEEVRYLSSVFFDEKERSKKQCHIYDNIIEFTNYYQETRW